MNDLSFARHQMVRVRRETRRRLVRVVEVGWVTPGMRRVRFESEELLDFESLGADDHVKLFLPDGAGRRDYTPRAFDASLGTLTIDFAAHEAGPATSWALAAVVGDTVEIGGPRGSLVVPDDFDWYLC